MLKNIPALLSPELLATLCEMGHSDVIVLGDANFPGKRYAHEGNCKFLRADGIGGAALLEAILRVIPTDSYSDTPVMLMQTMACDSDLEIPIWKEYEKIVERNDPRGKRAVGYMERFAFYEAAKKSYCIVQTGETAIYANVIIQKGVIQ